VFDQLYMVGQRTAGGILDNLNKRFEAILRKSFKMAPTNTCIDPAEAPTGDEMSS